MSGIKGQPITVNNIQQRLEEQKEAHNGYGYNEMAKLVRGGVSAAAIGRTCHMSRRAAEKRVKLIKDREGIKWTQPTES